MKTSKLLKIQRHLAKGRDITPLKALRLCNCLSLSQRIGQLKRRGFPIQSEMVYRTNSRFMRYWIDVETVNL